MPKLIKTHGVETDLEQVQYLLGHFQLVHLRLQETKHHGIRIGASATTIRHLLSIISYAEEKLREETNSNINEEG